MKSVELTDENVPEMVRKDVAIKKHDGYEVAFQYGYEYDEEDREYFQKFVIGYFDAGAPFSNFGWITTIIVVKPNDFPEYETHHFQVDLFKTYLGLIDEKFRNYWTGKDE